MTMMSCCKKITMSSSKKIAKILLVLFLVFVALFLASVAWPLDADNNDKIVVEEEQWKWSAEAVSSMSKSNTMSAAVSLLAGSERKTGAPVLELDEIKERIDAKSEADIRAAIIATTDAKGRKKNGLDRTIANFAFSIDPAATCSAADTVGGLGLDACAAACDHTALFSAKDSRKASCHVLCVLAIAPCKEKEEGSFSWTALPNNCMVQVEKTLTWTTVRVDQAMTPDMIIFLFLLLAFVVCLLRNRFAAGAWRARGDELRKKSNLYGRGLVKLKASKIVDIRQRHLQKEALHAIHDHAALATYQASEKKAKALRVQAAIDAFVAKQGTRDKGDSACVVS